MSVQPVSCNLKLNTVYVQKVEFTRLDTYKDDDESLHFSLRPDIKISDDNKKCKCSMEVQINNKQNESLDIKIIITAIFDLINFDDLKDDKKHNLISKNTLAILFPYLRSFITTITSQSGIRPIILPVININTLIDSQPDNKQS